MINATDIVFAVIKPALQNLGMLSPAGVALLAGTCAAESGVGNYLLQSTYVPGSDLTAFKGGLGLFQMQIDDHDDIITNFLPGNAIIKQNLVTTCVKFDPLKLISDLNYAAMFCRVHYLRNSQPLPTWDDVNGLANYWKTHYNSSKGAGDIAHFVNNYSLVQKAVESLVGKS